MIKLVSNDTYDPILVTNDNALSGFYVFIQNMNTKTRKICGYGIFWYFLAYIQ